MRKNIVLVVLLKVVDACRGNPDAQIEGFGRNFTSDLIQSRAHLGESRFFSKDDIVCQFFGYGPKDESGPPGPYWGPPYMGYYPRPKFTGDKFKVDVSAWLQGTLLWNAGQTVQAVAHEWLEQNPMPSNRTSKRDYKPTFVEMHDRCSALAAFDNHLTHDGAFIMPPTRIKALEQMDNLHKLAATFVSDKTRLGNVTVADLLYLREEIGDVFGSLNASSPLNHDGTFDWYKAAKNCIASGNHTDSRRTFWGWEEHVKYLNGPSNNEAGIWHINRCDKPYYFSVVNPDGASNGSIAVPANSVYFEPYVPLDIEKGGISVKIADEPFEYLKGDTAITQFEYSLAVNRTDRMCMDLSFVDCGPHTNDRVNPDERRTFADCPFRSEGWLAKWRDGDAIGCPHTYCEAVEDQNTDCEDAYHEPKDDWATKTCVWGMDAEQYLDIELISCPNKKDLKNLGSTLEIGTF